MRYSIFDNGFAMEVNAYYLSKHEALKMAGELLDEGSEEITIVNMEAYIAEQEATK